MVHQDMTHWRVLAAVSAVTWGGFFIFDIPASLSTSLSQHFGLPDHQFAYLISLLYTVYAVPNTVLPFLSGPAVQRFGERAILIATISSITLGQLLFALSLQAKVEFGLVAGRVLIGLGNEVISVICYEVITRWFHDKSLSLALAINLGAGRVGSVANSIIIPRLTGPYGPVSATWIATGLALGVSIVSAMYLLTVMQPVIDETQPANDKENGTSFFTKLSFRQFPTAFWHLALLCVFSFGCQGTFTNSAQRFLAERFYHGDQRAAGSAMSIQFILSGILVPTFGFALDKLSSSSYSIGLMASNILFMLAHEIFLAKAVSNPLIPLCVLGTADALLSVSFWASLVRCLSQVEADEQKPLLSKDETETEPLLQSIASLLPHDDNDDGHGQDEENTNPKANHVGHTPNATRTFGLGIITSLMNTSAAVVPVPLAIMENFAGFSGLEGFFVTLAFLGFVAAVRVAWF